MNDRTGMPAFVVKTMETDAEKDGKAFVHYTAWTETYTGLMPEEYLSGRSLDRQRQRTYEHPENTLVAVADGRVVGFACYHPAARDFVSVKPAAEIGALYVLEAYQRRGIGSALMRACLSRMPPLPTALFVLRGNEKAIRFYEKNGFVFTGARLEQPVTGGTLVELEMVRAADRPKKPVSGTGNRLAKPGGDVYNISLYPENRERKRPICPTRPCIVPIPAANCAQKTPGRP